MLDMITEGHWVTRMSAQDDDICEAVTTVCTGRGLVALAATRPPKLRTAH